MAMPRASIALRRARMPAAASRSKTATMSPPRCAYPWGDGLGGDRGAGEGRGQDGGLARSGGEQEDGTGPEDQRGTHRNRVAGTFRDAWKMAIDDGVVDGVGVQAHQQHRVAGEGNARFMEGDVAVLADADDLQVDAAGALDVPSIGVEDVGADPAEIGRTRIGADGDGFAWAGT